MNIYDHANQLAEEIRQSDMRKEYARLQEEAMADETNRALLKEYKRLQVALQMRAMGGDTTPSEDMQRFQQISTLLYMNSDVQAYLLAEIQLQKTLADVIKILTDAAGIRFDFPQA